MNVGGWFLSDDSNQPRKYRLPDATFIAPGGFLVLTENEFNRPNPASLIAPCLHKAVYTIISAVISLSAQFFEQSLR